MKLKKKEFVLDTLKKHAEKISLNDLLLLLGSGFAERSVRRWLTELADENLVIINGKKRSTLYQASPIEEKQTALITSSIFTPASKASIAHVKKPIFERYPARYLFDWLNEYKPNETFLLEETQRAFLHEESSGTSNYAPAGTYARKICNRLLIDLSYNSSRLEGNTYSLIETKQLLIDGQSAEGKLDSERVMILNHKEAIRYLVDNAPKLTLDSNEILTLHYLLSDGLLNPELCGKVRKEGVRITGSTYQPLNNREQLNTQLNLICNKGKLIKDPYEQSFFMLVHLAYLQAFQDVNKRTSRLSANIPLIKNNRVPLSFNKVDTEDYISTMISIYELNDAKPLSDLYLFSYQKTCEEYKLLPDITDFDEARIKYRRILRTLIRDIVTQRLIGDKMETFILDTTQKKVAPQDHKNFVSIINEELRLICPERSAGLGITKQELEKWLQAKKNHT